MAQANDVRFATTSYTGATNLRLTTWAVATISPQAKVTDRRRLTTGPSLRSGPKRPSTGPPPVGALVRLVVSPQFDIL